MERIKKFLDEDETLFQRYLNSHEASPTYYPIIRREIGIYI